MTNPTHVWLEYPETGGTAQFSVESAEVWQSRGWVPCDPPAEPDITEEPPPVAAAPTAEPAVAGVVPDVAGDVGALTEPVDGTPTESAAQPATETESAAEPAPSQEQ